MRLPFRAAVTVVFFFCSCQKYLSAPPPAGDSVATKAVTSGGSGGLPEPFWWSHPTDIQVPPGGYYLFASDQHGFTINGKGYLVGGRYWSYQSTSTGTSDLWEYDPTANSWTKRADFPGGSGIEELCHFVIGSKAYVFAGNQGWVWDQGTDIWSPIASIPTFHPGRLGGSAFVIRGKGYIGLGHSVENNGSVAALADWWQYDPVQNHWTQLKNFPGGPQEFAPAFAIGGYGYICSVNAATNRQQFYQYNPGMDSWTGKAAPPTAGLAFGAGLNGVVNSGTPVGFILKGGPNGVVQYNPATDVWTVVTNIPGGVRGAFGAFMIDRNIFLAAGYGPGPYYYRSDVVELSYAK